MSSVDYFLTGPKYTKQDEVSQRPVFWPAYDLPEK